MDIVQYDSKELIGFYIKNKIYNIISPLNG